MRRKYGKRRFAGRGRRAVRRVVRRRRSGRGMRTPRAGKIGFRL